MFVLIYENVLCTSAIGLYLCSADRLLQDMTNDTHQKKSKSTSIHSYGVRDDKGKCEIWSSVRYYGSNYSALRTDVPGPNRTTVKRTVTTELTSARALLLLQSKEKF